MARFFVDDLPQEGSFYSLAGENAEHAKVLRLKPGEAVTLCDGYGMDCPCVVAEGGSLLVGPALPCSVEPRVKVSVYFAFPKGDKAEHVIQKAVELGAAEIVLFPSRYCVSRPDDKSLGRKLDRWQKIARAAAEQSGRGVIPPVRVAGSFEKALAEAAGADVSIFFYENEEQYGIRDVFASGGRPMAAPAAVSLVTGSEGGFSEEEVAQARAAGMKVCTLGPRILRCETAPLVGLTAVMYALGEI